MELGGKLATGKLAMREEDSRNNYGKTQRQPTEKTHPQLYFQKSKSAGDLERKSLDSQGKKKLVLQ